MVFTSTVQELTHLLQHLRGSYAAVRCIEVQFSRMQPPYRPDPVAIEELVWFVLEQGTKTFTLHNGDVFVVYANDFKPTQLETFIGHLPIGSEHFMVTHCTDDELATLIARLQTNE